MPPVLAAAAKSTRSVVSPVTRSQVARQHSAKEFSFVPGFTDLDDLSNSVVDLIKGGHLDKAEAVCHELLSRYPDQIDGTERLAEVYAARGEKQKAAQAYREAARFAQANPGFDQELIDWYLSKAKALEANH